MLLARVAMRTAVAQTDKSICLFAMRLLRVETKSNLLATLIGCRADFHLFLLIGKNPVIFSEALGFFFVNPLKDTGV